MGIFGCHAARHNAELTTTADGVHGMRFAFRLLWFLGYHLVLLAAIVATSNRSRGTGSVLFGAIAFLIGGVIVLQASAKLPAFCHGISLLVILPGVVAFGPLALAPVYETVVMSPQSVSVLSQSSHTVSDIFSTGKYDYSYTNVQVRLPDGSIHDGIVRPARNVPSGHPFRIRVDPLHLVRPQFNSQGDSAIELLVTTFALIMAEMELMSSLIRRDGSSFIAASGQSGQPGNVAHE